MNWCRSIKTLRAPSFIKEPQRIPRPKYVIEIYFDSIWSVTYTWSGGKGLEKRSNLNFKVNSDLVLSMSNEANEGTKF